MKYRYMGKTGLMVSRICLGAMNFGTKDWGCDKKTSIRIMEKFLEAGGNFIDTADVYSMGASEEMVGEALKGKNRHDVVIATKGFFRMRKSPNARGLSRKYLMAACEESLRRLSMDFIDLYQLHGPDPLTPIEETMRACDDLVRQGKVRYIGCSNFFAWQILKANMAAERMNGEKLVCGQYLYNLIMRDVEREILGACADQGMGLICWSPLASGMLTGKYKRSEKPEEGSRIAFRAGADMPRYWNERGFKISEAVLHASHEAGKTPAQTALSWLLHDRRVTAVIIGAKSEDQLADNLVPGEWDMPQALHAQLDNIAALDLGYPKQWMDIALPGNFNDQEFPKLS